MSWTNKDINRQLGITSVTDIVKRPKWLEEEIKIRPNELSSIPPEYRRYHHCPVCLYMFELDSRRNLQIVQCPNFHVMEVKKNGFGGFSYKYRPDIPPSKRNTLNADKIAQALISHQRKGDDKVWIDGKTPAL